MNKLSTLGYLPGGNGAYIDTLRKCLGFVKQGVPAKEDLISWFQDNYGSQSPQVNLSYLRIVTNLQLVHESRDRFLLTELGERFLSTGDNNIVFRQLDQRYTGISDIPKILSEGSLTFDKLCFGLRKRIGAEWKTYKQCGIRLSWLLSLGYLAVDGSKWSLATERKEIVGMDQEPKGKESKKHKEMKELISELGEAYGYFANKEFRIDRMKYDVVWKRSERAANPSYVFEIQERGSLDRALRKLKFALMNGVGELFLIIDAKKKKEAEDLVNDTLDEIKGKIKIKTPEEMKEWHKSTMAANKTARTIGGYRGIMPRLRRKSMIKNEEDVPPRFRVNSSRSR